MSTITQDLLTVFPHNVVVDAKVVRIIVRVESIPDIVHNNSREG